MGSTQQLYSLNWGEFRNSLSSTVQNLRNRGDLVDVTLTAGGKIFPAHKLVLGAASPLLMELLKSTKCEHPVVMLAGITSVDLEVLLEFIYQGEVSVDPSQLPSLLQAAQCLNIQALSPSILSVDKTGQPIMAPFHDSSNRPMISPFVSVKKRKKKMSNSSTCTEEDLDAGTSKDSYPRKTPLVSDLPVSCSICGVTLRQSRNLRRHMELMHLNPGGERKTSKSRKGHQESQQQNNQQQDVNNMTPGNSTQTGQNNVDNTSIGSNESRVPNTGSMPENRLPDGRLADTRQSSIDNRQQMMDPRHPTDHSTRIQTDGRQDLAHYPSTSVCEPIHTFLHIDPVYMMRPAEFYRHQQA